MKTGPHLAEPPMSDHSVNSDHCKAALKANTSGTRKNTNPSQPDTSSLLWNMLKVPWLLWLRTGPQVSSFYPCFYLFLYSTFALLSERHLLFIHMLQCCWGCFYKRTWPKSAAAPMPFQGLAEQGHNFFFLTVLACLAQTRKHKPTITYYIFHQSSERSC